MWREFDPAAPKLSDAARPSELDVADPWYGGYDDFVETLEMVEAAADGILDQVS